MTTLVFNWNIIFALIVKHQYTYTKELRYLFLINLKIMFIWLDNQLSLLSQYRMTWGTCKLGFDLVVKRTRWVSLSWQKAPKWPQIYFHHFKKKLGVGGSLKIKSSLPFTFLFAEFSYVISTHRPYLNLELVNDTKPKIPQGGKSLNLTNLIKNPLLFNNNQ